MVVIFSTLPSHNHHHHSLSATNITPCLCFMGGTVLQHLMVQSCNFNPSPHTGFPPLASGRRKAQSSGNSRPKSVFIVRSQAVKPATYSARIATDIPLYESPEASFDHYLEDKPRVFRAIFPDKQRSRPLNEEEWRIQMLPIQFLFVTVWPIIDMRLRYKSGGTDYPSGVPPRITKLVELDIIRWKLKGLEDIVKPSEFTLGVKGALYPDRQRNQTRLKGQLQMTISFVLPPVLELVPESVRRELAESVLKGLVDNMKDKVNGSLLADYSAFKKEKLKSLV